jgi:hypothetical protein
MKRKIALFFAILLLWTAGMSVMRVVFYQELDATKLGVIISVGAIYTFVLVLAGHILEITQSKIAMFFVFFWSWTAGMVFYRFISNQYISATGIGITVFLGVIFGLFTVLVTHISEKPKR